MKNKNILKMRIKIELFSKRKVKKWVEHDIGIYPSFIECNKLFSRVLFYILLFVLASILFYAFVRSVFLLRLFWLYLFVFSLCLYHIYRYGICFVYRKYYNSYWEKLKKEQSKNTKSDGILIYQSEDFKKLSEEEKIKEISKSNGM